MAQTEHDSLETVITKMYEEAESSYQIYKEAESSYQICNNRNKRKRRYRKNRTTAKYTTPRPERTKRSVKHKKDAPCPLTENSKQNYVFLARRMGRKNIHREMERGLKEGQEYKTMSGNETGQTPNETKVQDEEESIHSTDDSEDEDCGCPVTDQKDMMISELNQILQDAQALQVRLKDSTEESQKREEQIHSSGKVQDRVSELRPRQVGQDLYTVEYHSLQVRELQEVL